MSKKEYYKDIITRMILKEKEFTCGCESSQRYLRLDENRFAFILDVCRKEIQKDCAILDVGRSHLTKVLQENYKNVTSLGLDLGLDDGGHRELSPLTNVKHITFNLEDAANTDNWPDLSQAFGSIICTEVIEHLTISPDVLFLFFHYLLREKGKLILSTPNAVSFRKRIAMCRGMHPFEKLRLYKMNTGHYREYTDQELNLYFATTGFSVERCFYIDFRENPFSFVKCLRRPLLLINLLPKVFPQLRDSIFFIVQKRDMQS